MTPRQEAIALITAAYDPELQLELWRTLETSQFQIASELARIARAALCAYAVAEGIDVEGLLQAFGVSMADA